MIDNRHNEEEEFDAKVFLHERKAGENFEALKHSFTYLGKGRLPGALAPYFTLNIFRVTDPAGIEQLVGSPVEIAETDPDELLDLFDKLYGSQAFMWTEYIELGELIPLHHIEDEEKPELVAHPEVQLSSRQWVEADPHSHKTRVGGYPSFGDYKEYGQPHGKSDNGEWAPLPFMAQYILPDGRYVHIYAAEDADSSPDEHLDIDPNYLGDKTFEYDNPNRAIALVEGGTIPDGVCLMPVTETGRMTLRTTAAEVKDGDWPKGVVYFQGSETDDELPYSLFCIPGWSSFGEDLDRTIPYADTYVVWDCKNKAKVFELYD